MKTALLTVALSASLFGQPGNLKFPPLSKITKPDVQVLVLPNGIKLYLMENHNLPLVSGTAIIRPGSLLFRFFRMCVG